MSQLRGVVLGAAIFLNSKKPVLGQTKYLEGREVLGSGSVTIRASSAAFLGRTKSLGGLSLRGSREYFEDVDVGWLASFDCGPEGLVDLVRAMSGIGGCRELIGRIDAQGRRCLG